MPMKVIWDDENQTIIRQIYTGVVTTEDYYAAIDEFALLASSVTHTVHSIMDRREIQVVTGSYMNALRYGNGKMPDNLGLRVIINANGMTKMMINIGTRIAPRLVANIHFVNTLEQAYEVIASHQQTTS